MRSFSVLNPTGVFVLAVLTLFGVLTPADKNKGSSLSSGKLPTCNAGAPQIVECTGTITTVQLDATGSTNPVEGELIYKWEICNDPRISIDDPTSATPILYIDLQGSCSFTCKPGLAVRNQYGVSNCSTTVTVQDTTAPVLTCPADVTVLEGDPTDPTATGTATATDLRDPNPIVSYVDDLSQAPDAILRVWSADDGCQTSSCTQTITVVAPPPIEPHFDIQPGKCPNEVEVEGADFMVVSFPTVLLGNDFDVTQVDLSTLNLSRGVFFLGGQSVLPIIAEIGDVGTPFVGEQCGCNTLGPDGIPDLVVRFNKAEMVQVLGLDQEPSGTVVELQLSGSLWDASAFTGRDCITLIVK